MRSALLFFGWGFTFAILFFGCSKQRVSEGIQISTTGRIPTKLLSEVMVDGTLAAIECPIEISNSASNTRTFRLDGTGCSCYGVWLGKKKLETGEEIHVESGEVLDVSIRAQSASRQSVRKFNADFSIPDGEERRGLRLECSLQIYQDLKVSPKIIECFTTPGEDSRSKRTVTIERIFRSESGDSPDPRLTHLPSGVDVLSVKKERTAEPLEPGIWKMIWKVEIAVDVSKEISPQGETDEILVQFGSEKVTDPNVKRMEKLRSAPLAATAKIQRKLRVPIVYPSSIHFGALKSGETRERSIFFSGIGGREFRLSVDQKTLPANVKVDIDEQLANSHRIKVSLTESITQVADNKSEGSHSIEQTLVLNTSLKEQPTIEIGLKAYRTQEQDK